MVLGYMMMMLCQAESDLLVHLSHEFQNVILYLVTKGIETDSTECNQHSVQDPSVDDDVGDHDHAAQCDDDHPPPPSCQSHTLEWLWCLLLIQ